MPIRRRDLLLAGVAGGLARAWAAEALRVRLQEGQLFVSSPQLRFLTGRPLERLHDGASVWYDFQLTALSDRPAPGVTPRVLERAIERFAVSYDIWEEKYSVASLGSARRSASHLTSAAAEAWCLDHLPLPAAALPPGRTFWLRLEVRAEDPGDRPPLFGEPGINLSRLIELFSRPSRAGQPAWVVEDGPFRTADLKSSPRGDGAA